MIIGDSMAKERGQKTYESVENLWQRYLDENANPQDLVKRIRGHGLYAAQVKDDEIDEPVVAKLLDGESATKRLMTLIEASGVLAEWDSGDVDSYSAVKRQTLAHYMKVKKIPAYGEIVEDIDRFESEFLGDISGVDPFASTRQRADESAPKTASRNERRRRTPRRTAPITRERPADYTESRRTREGPPESEAEPAQRQAPAAEKPIRIEAEGRLAKRYLRSRGVARRPAAGQRQQVTRYRPTVPLYRTVASAVWKHLMRDKAEERKDMEMRMKIMREGD